MSEKVDLDYLSFIRVVNGVCLVPYVLLIIIYLIKIKEFNISKGVNTLFGLVVSSMNVSYFFNFEKYELEEYSEPCKAQGALYVSSLMTTVYFCVFIAILFFLIAINPQTIDKYSKCYFGSFMAFCMIHWLGVYSIIVKYAKFSINSNISVCRLNQEESKKLYYILVGILIVLTLFGLILTCIVIFCGQKIAKIKDTFEKYSKKMRMICIMQAICLFTLLFNRFTETVFNDKIIISKILDTILCILWMILVCVNGFNKQTRDDIKRLFGIKVDEENRNSSDPEAMLQVLRNTFASQTSDVI